LIARITFLTKRKRKPLQVEKAKMETKRKLRKPNPLHAEFHHSHDQVARLVYDIITIIDRGWVAALMWKGKAYEAAAHYLLSLTAPKDPNARCVKGLSDSFRKSAPVKVRHHACHNKCSKTGHPDSEYPAMINRFGFSEEMAAEWLAGKPPWLKAVDRPWKDRRRRPASASGTPRAIERAEAPTVDELFES
jgi:hypothetical protein